MICVLNRITRLNYIHWSWLDFLYKYIVCLYDQYYPTWKKQTNITVSHVSTGRANAMDAANTNLDTVNGVEGYLLNVWHPN